MDKRNRKALILCSGGLRGAYSAGFMSEFCRKKGNKYFDSVYCVSVGTTIGTFFVANQPEVIENTWRRYVDGKKLVNPTKLLLGKRILDLDYLIGLFKGKSAHLDIDTVMRSHTKLRYILLNYRTAEVVCVNPRRDNMLNLIKAACSLPLINGPVVVDNQPYIDAALILDGIPLLDTIVKKYDETTIVLNFPRGFTLSKQWRLLQESYKKLISSMNPQLANVLGNARNTFEYIYHVAERNKSVKIISPDTSGAFASMFDAHKKKVHAMIDLGIHDAVRHFDGF